MFGFFKSKEPSVPVNDQVWISSEAKFEKCRRLLRKNPNHLFLFWFVESFENFRSNLGLERNSPNIAYANEISVVDIQGQFPIFCEHYPQRKTEQALFLKLQLKEVTVFSSLDEELFQTLGGKNIVEVMKKFRINDEAISHPMINASIRRAQEKLEKKVPLEQKIDSSQKDWFSANLRS